MWKPKNSHLKKVRSLAIAVLMLQVHEKRASVHIASKVHTHKTDAVVVEKQCEERPQSQNARIVEDENTANTR